MTGPNDHERWEELAVGYALDALEPADEDAFQTHLPSCPVCAATVADTQQLMTELAYAAEPVAPPPELRDRIRADVAATPRPKSPPPPAPASGRAKPSTTSARSAGGPTGRRPPRGSKRMTRPGGRRWGRVPWRRSRRLTRRGEVLGAAAIVAGLGVVGALIGWAMVLRGEQVDARQQADRAQAVVTCVQDSQCTAVKLLAPTTHAPAAVALVKAGKAQLVIDGLAKDDTRRQIYVLWQQLGNGSMAPLKTFDVTTHGLEFVDVGTLARQDSSPQLLAISLEHGRSAPPKPSTPIAVGVLNG